MRRLNLVAHRWRPVLARQNIHRGTQLRPSTLSVSPSNLRFCSCTSSAPDTTTPTTSSSSSSSSSPSSSTSSYPDGAPVKPETQPAAAQAQPPTAKHIPDHRQIGIEQELFTLSNYSPGSPLFTPEGTHILNKLTSFLRAQYKRYGFREVLTPSIYKRSLWETSGHWANYKDDMYEVRGRGADGGAAKTEKSESVEAGEDESYGLKPMNCPGHCILFGSRNRSYRDLPIRYADFSALHRNEVSGALSGLTRVRRFHQDDAHIFCRPQQIGSEIMQALQFTDTVLRTFGLGDKYRLVLSTRPEKSFLGSQELWDSAEDQLREALDKSGKAWELNAGDGAFYGPKIDLQVQDVHGRYHQLSTIQLDMNLPKRFELKYTVAQNQADYNPATPGLARPVLIHRAIFGSLERFFALLSEHYNGRWPFWLSPRQAVIITVNQDAEVVRAAKYAAEIMSGYQPVSEQAEPEKRDALSDNPPADPYTNSEPDMTAGLPLYMNHPTFNVDVDSSGSTLLKKFRDARVKKYKLVVVIGERDLKSRSVNVDMTDLFPHTRDEREIRKVLNGVRNWKLTIEKTGIKTQIEINGLHRFCMNIDRLYR